ncbi:MAG: class I SAM-dependent methyltransferase [Paracoccaceae bacterium]
MSETTRAALEQDVVARMADLRAAIGTYRSVHKCLPDCMKEGETTRLNPEFLQHARVFPDRNAMFSALAVGPVAAEVGVQYGHFSRFMLDHSDVRTLYLFDSRTDLIRDDVRSDPRVRIQKGDSSGLLCSLADGSLDWVYIDADHRYAGVKKDAEAALQKVRKGGILFFNDYTPWSPVEVMAYGIMPVVNDLVNQGHDLIGIGLNPWGYFDMALRN